MFPDNWLLLNVKELSFWSIPIPLGMTPESALSFTAKTCNSARFCMQSEICPAILLLKRFNMTIMEKLHIIVGKVPAKLFRLIDNTCNMVALDKEETKFKSAGPPAPRKLLSMIRRCSLINLCRAGTWP